MRSQIPKFRLPDEVIDEEVGYALSTGGQFVAERRVDSLRAPWAKATTRFRRLRGAARRNLDISGAAKRRQHSYWHRLAGERFVWPCLVDRPARGRIRRRQHGYGLAGRRARRLGGRLKVVVRSGFCRMKASPWEKEDAIREGVEILNFLAPKAFTHDSGRLTSVVFETMAAKKTSAGVAYSRPRASQTLSSNAMMC